MGQSPFINFDPEKNSDTDSLSMYKAPMSILGVSLLLSNCIAACARREEKDKFRVSYLLKNDEFALLGKRVEGLAHFGFENRSTASWIDPERRDATKYEEYSITNWASFGKEISNPNDITMSQINGMCALWSIDEVLSIVNNHGWTNDALEGILFAAFLESEARDEEAADYIDFLKNSHEEKIETGVRQRQSAIYRKANEKRLEPIRAIKKEAVRLYLNGSNWRSRRQAAKAITPLVQAFGKEKFERQLSLDRVEQTVYEWLGEHDRKDLRK
jgi:hypothetical protein